MNMQLSRAKFEALTAELVQRTVSPCEKALKDADVGRTEISDVILVGGMTRMPKVCVCLSVCMSVILTGRVGVIVLHLTVSHWLTTAKGTDPLSVHLEKVEI